MTIPIPFTLSLLYPLNALESPSIILLSHLLPIFLTTLFCLLYICYTLYVTLYTLICLLKFII